MKYLNIILKVMIGLMGVVLIYNGVVWGFYPDNNFALYDIQVNTLGGLNMIRSDIGGPLLVAGLFAILYAVRGDKWYLPTLMISGGYLLVRIASIIMDGYSQVALTGIVAEIIFVIMMVTSYIISKLQNQEA